MATRACLATAKKLHSGCGRPCERATLRRPWRYRICICVETEYRRAATKRVYCWTRPHARAARPPPSDCETCRPSDVSESWIREIIRPGSALHFTSTQRRLPARDSRRKFRLGPARFIPQRKFHAIPESKLVVDNAKIVLHHVFRGADGMGDVAVLQALGNKFDDSVLTLAGDTGSITFVCKHNCLRYNRVASFTRLIPPVIPKRRNNRLK